MNLLFFLVASCRQGEAIMEHGSVTDSTASTFSIVEEDHTLANSVRFVLNQECVQVPPLIDVFVLTKQDSFRFCGVDIKRLWLPLEVQSKLFVL